MKLIKPTLQNVFRECGYRTIQKNENKIAFIRDTEAVIITEPDFGFDYISSNHELSTKLDELENNYYSNKNQRK